jgi:hypothetical protein
MITDQRRLFTEMGKDAGDHQFRASPTISDLPIQTVDPAFPWTEPTLLEKFLENLDPLAKFTFLKKRDIGWYESHRMAILVRR